MIPDYEIEKEKQEERRKYIAWAVRNEMKKQDAKWGEMRSHLSVPEKMHFDDHRNYTLMIASEQSAKNNCDLAFSKGQGSWAAIAIEELSESIHANTDSEMVIELIQTIAVLTQWVENIYRNTDHESEHKSRVNIVNEVEWQEYIKYKDWLNSK